MVMEDISQVSAIEREVFPTNWSWTNFSKELKNLQIQYLVCALGDTEAPLAPSHERRTIWDRITRRFSRGAMRAAQHVETIIGFVGIWFMGGEAHITAIAVKELYRGFGVGDLLMLGTVELTIYREHQLVSLEVRVSNVLAQSLYAKYGFSQTRVRKRYYSDNREDAYAMSTEEVHSPVYQRLLESCRTEFVERHGLIHRVYAYSTQ